MENLDDLRPWGLMFRLAGDSVPVGKFEEGVQPRKPGLYLYMPFRSIGHLMMSKILGAGGNPRCYYETDDERVVFVVDNGPEYGVLELRDFATSRLTDSLPTQDDSVSLDDYIPEGP